MPPPPIPYDQNSAQFFDQLKDMARGFLAWIQEEGQETEHPGAGQTIDQVPMRHPADPVHGTTTPGGGAAPMPLDSGEVTAQPTLLRTKTTTVHDFTPPGGGTPGAGTPGSATPQPGQSIATDPPVSQAQRGATHAAAAGNSTLGIPSSVGKEFANADPGGKLPEKKGEDDAAGERFSLSPDGRTIIDSQGGKSYPIEEAMRILFSDGQPQDVAPNTVAPAGKVTVNPPDKAAVNTAQWSVPKIKPPGEDDHELGEGLGGIVLGQLLKLKAGEAGGAQPQSLPPRGNGAGLNPRGGEMPVRDHGWMVPKFAAPVGRKP